DVRMAATSPDKYGIRGGAAELSSPQTPAEIRKLIDDVVKTNGDDGAKAVRTLGDAILQSAKTFDTRCEDVARLMNDAAARLAAQAELILKMIHEATAMVEDMQRKAVNTAQLVASDARLVASDARLVASDAHLVASDEAVPDTAATPGKVAAI